MAAALSAKGIQFSYPGMEVLLEGVDIELFENEIVGVIGPNGSGKTTLLNILSWTTKPQAGEVLAFEKPLGSLSAKERARTMAMVPQEPSVAFPFSVAEIVLMGRGPYLGRWELEGKEDMEITRGALEMTGLSGLWQRRFMELSGGEKQRVMIAKALAQRSRIMLLDEPTAFLDLKHQVEIYGLIRRLAAEHGIAIMVVSHDINLAAMFCDRLAVLSGGKIRAAGPPAEVLSPALLEGVYGVPVVLLNHPDRGDAPLVFPAGRGS